MILKITWDSWRVVSTTDPGDMESDLMPTSGEPSRQFSSTSANAREH